MTGEEQARSGLDHLQVAAIELIAAARAFLDVAEDLVREPGAATTVVRTAVALVTAATRPTGQGDGAEGGDPGAEPSPGVRRIHVSDE